MYSFGPYVNSTLYCKFYQEGWYNDLLNYSRSRYHSIEERFIDTFRYVECDPGNYATFSYEYGSLVRDIGSVFSSILDKLVRETKFPEIKEKNETNMGHYRQWLQKEIEELHLSLIEIKISNYNRYLRPFANFDGQETSLKWWKAFTSLKHSDIENHVLGNFENCFNALGALATMCLLLRPDSHEEFFMKIKREDDMELFRDIKYVRPTELESIDKFLFFKQEK